ncbi:metallophosphoesterase [Selenomonas sp. F0473]|uniref:metallophosphoesterase family protein n=1 Tax=Selenomonas sp. F0473 TaxID=999423 RepID=UPI00029E7320|nr:metallophosphoesterase [Selenomonas sp. F0473]EKU71777.1 MJ0936 family phosphodiesterase [Selenomonas sp. F0473]
MRIGIVSDSHGDVRVFEDMLAVPGAADAELWLHAGDHAADAETLRLLTEKTVVCVLGNCDYDEDGVYHETSADVGGHRIFLAHGHLFRVEFGTERLVAAAREAGADIAVYGHTHIAREERGGVTVLNPGSIARPRDERRGSFMLLDLEEGAAPRVKLIRIG